MERGTDWEREAVRDRWTAMERRRARATRLLSGLTLAAGGGVFLLVAAATEVCYARMGGGIVDCAPVTPEPRALVFLLLGVVALAVGTWNCWAALRG